MSLPLQPHSTAPYTPVLTIPASEAQAVKVLNAPAAAVKEDLQRECAIFSAGDAAYRYEL